MFEPGIHELASRGHDVHLALGRGGVLGWKPALVIYRRSSADYVDFSPRPWRRSGGGREDDPAVGRHLRTLQKDYDTTPKLKARGNTVPPARWADHATAPPAGQSPKLLAVLRALERASQFGNRAGTESA